MTLVDYSENFWVGKFFKKIEKLQGEKHIGYHALYENLKKGEDCCQELATFVKERINLEEDLLKFLNKSLIRVSIGVFNEFNLEKFK